MFRKMLNSEQPFKSAIPWETISKALNLVGTARCNSNLMEKPMSYTIFNFSTSGRFAPSAWASCLMVGQDAHFAPVLIFAFLGYNEKCYKVQCVMCGKEIEWTIRPYLQISGKNNNQQYICHWSLGWAFWLTLPYLDWWNFCEHPKIL